MKFNKRLLEERSHLTFEFPQTNGRAIRTYLPILENPEVTENKKGTYVDYSLLSRSSSIFAYLGAKSRSINLKFNITFLHLLDKIGKEGLSEKFKQHFILFFDNKESLKKAFFAFYYLGRSFEESAKAIADYTRPGRGVEHAKRHREYYQKLAQIGIGQPTLFDNLSNFVITDILQEAAIPTEQDRYNELNKLIDLVIFWINLIRASVNNNSSNTTLGPPIVRLTHGPLYNNIPCIVDSYSISINNDAGFDVQTMLPRQIQVSLLLNEVRTGNFEEFKSSKVIDGDNNVGWEAVITENNMDPYNGLIN